MRANPEMKKYFDNQHRKAKEKGFITNPFGAFLLMPDVPNEDNKVDYNTKKKIEKQKKKALNFPIQSSNAFLLYVNDDYLGIDIEIGTSWGNTEHIKRPKRTKEEVEVYDFREF